MIKRPFSFIACAALAATLVARAHAADDSDSAKKSGDDKDKAEAAGFFNPTEKMTDGTVTVDGTTIRYQAVAGTLVVHPRYWNDVPSLEGSEDADRIKKDPEPVASMFFVAYFKKGAEADKRPITFLYNGGPGSSTVWLHIGAFGPKRVVTSDDTHTPAAPYELVNNDSSLLDASDLVFIDAPGTGFSRIAGKDAGKAFYRAVFGYQYQDVSGDGFRYAMLMVDGHEVGGIGQYTAGPRPGHPRRGAPTSR